MDLARYVDLYVAETQEHLRALSRGLLELEAAGGGAALDEAFRAAHTIKGMSATMGFAVVTRLAHDLEDRLDDVRSGRRAIGAALADELLGLADALERAVDDAVDGRPARGGAPVERVAGGAAAGAEDDRLGAGSDAAPPAGTALVAHVALRADTPLKAARARLVRREAARLGEVLGSDPAEFDDRLGAGFRLFLGPVTDAAALEAAIRGAGDVADVAIEAARPNGGDVHQPGAGGARAAAEAPAGNGGSDVRVRSRHVRVDQRHLDELANGIGELTILAARLDELLSAVGARGFDDVGDRMSRLLADLQHAVLAVRMVPVGEVFDRFTRVVRDAARSLGKEVDFRIEGRDIELDRAILEMMADPLVHLLRNAVDHGIEPPAERRGAGKADRGRLLLRAARERSAVVIRVEDDGRGIARERVLERASRDGPALAEAADDGDDALLRVLSRPGFSTAERVTEVSGRGVGLDVVVTRIRALGGAIQMESTPGAGTSFVIRLPLTLAVAQALRVRVGGEDYAVPLTHVAEAVELADEMVVRVRGREAVRLRGEVLPLVSMREVLAAPGTGRGSAAVIAEVGERRGALAVDELVGRDQIVVRGFDAAAGTLPIFSGVTLLADGRPALVLDPTSVL